MKTTTTAKRQARPAINWDEIHERAMNALSNEWENLPTLRSRTGIGGLVYAGVYSAGHAEMRIDVTAANVEAPTAHVFYRKAQAL